MVVVQHYPSSEIMCFMAESVHWWLKDELWILVLTTSKGVLRIVPQVPPIAPAIKSRTCFVSTALGGVREAQSIPVLEVLGF